MCYELRENVARLSSVFVIHRQSKKKLQWSFKNGCNQIDGLDAFIRKIIDLCMQKIQLAFMAHKNVENFKRPDYINIVK